MVKINPFFAEWWSGMNGWFLERPLHEETETQFVHQVWVCEQGQD
jgi:hypothetical protein